jgi:hypothetical protein
MKIDNGRGGSREALTGKRASVAERGLDSINFFAELKRRNVIRAAILYVGAIWALAQASL